MSMSIPDENIRSLDLPLFLFSPCHYLVTHFYQSLFRVTFREELDGVHGAVYKILG